jgi:hypothetical protein
MTTVSAAVEHPSRPPNDEARELYELWYPR